MQIQKSEYSSNVNQLTGHENSMVREGNCVVIPKHRSKEKFPVFIFKETEWMENSIWTLRFEGKKKNLPRLYLARTPTIARNQ